MAVAEPEYSKQRIALLKAEHSALDVRVNRLLKSQVFEDKQLRSLKSRKLYLKDQMQSLERNLATQPA